MADTVGAKLPEEVRPKKLWLKALHPQARDRLCAPELAPSHRGGLAAYAGEGYALQSRQLQSLFAAFQHAPDPRTRAGQQYPIGSVLALAALGLLLHKYRKYKCQIGAAQQ